jgi:hypothetical protein
MRHAVMFRVLISSVFAAFLRFFVHIAISFYSLFPEPFMHACI